MIVNPGIRRFLGSAIQRLFNSASFSAPLTHSLVLERGTGSPSFTRATTATGQKWDEAGYLDFTALAGEAIFTGARRERNFVSAASQDFSNAAWTKLSTTVVVNQAIAPDGTLTADLVHPTSTGADRVVYQNGLVSLVIGSTALLVIRAKYAGIRWLWFGTLGGGTTPAQLSFFDLQNGVAGQAGTYFDAVSMEDLGDGWYECAAIKNSLPAAPLFPVYGLGDADGSATVTANGTDGFYLWASQLNDITGETDQTTIRPYVSVGVESAPAYHGSMVDGVKCYNTDRSGNPISTSGSYPIVGYVPWEARTNLCLQSNAYNTAPWSNAFGTVAFTQNATGPDGATSAWTGVDSDGAVASYGAQSMTLTAANWTQRILVKKTTGAQATYPCFGAYRGSTDIAMCTIDTSNGIATVWTAYTGLTVSTSSARCNSYNALFWEVELTLLGTAAVWTQCLMKVPAGTSNPTQSTGVIDGTLQGSAVFYGGTMELGSFATPYIPTTTVAVARNADLLTYTGAGISALAGAPHTIFAEIVPRDITSVMALLIVDDGTTNNRTFLLDSTAVSDKGRLFVASGGATQADLEAGTMVNNIPYRMAGAVATNSACFAGAGSVSAEDTSVTLPAGLTTLRIGLNTAGTSSANCPVRNVRVWTRALSSSELQAITA